MTDPLRDPLVERHVTVAEAAVRLSVSPKTIRKYIADGILSAEKTPTDQWAVSAQDVTRLLTPLPERVLPAGVYFVASAGLVKIGMSGHIPRRMKELQSPDGRLLGFIPEADWARRERLEAEIHLQFRDARQHHEWFALTEDSVRACLLARGGQVLV